MPATTAARPTDPAVTRAVLCRKADAYYALAAEIPAHDPTYRQRLAIAQQA